MMVAPCPAAASTAAGAWRATADGDGRLPAAVVEEISTGEAAETGSECTVETGVEKEVGAGEGAGATEAAADAAGTDTDAGAGTTATGKVGAAVPLLLARAAKPSGCGWPPLTTCDQAPLTRETGLGAALVIPLPPALAAAGSPDEEEEETTSTAVAAAGTAVAAGLSKTDDDDDAMPARRLAGSVVCNQFPRLLLH